mmetsp:Transcript_17174/g.36926  ORF Transcript_17174/g.36926 Transcript_17174/m.36926 type:complete len:229 (-) Transcript_17174:462-1148(-)
MWGPGNLEVGIWSVQLTEELHARGAVEPADDSVIFAAGQNQVGIRRAPSDAEDALRVTLSLLEGVLDVSKIPHLHRRLSIVVVCDQELRGFFRVPRDVAASGSTCRVLEADDLLFLLQVPDNSRSLVGTGCQDVGDFFVPGHVENLRSLVRLCGLRGLIHLRSGRVVAIEDVDLAVPAASGQKIRFHWVELHRVYGARVDLRGVKKAGIRALGGRDLVGVPEGDDAVL